MFGGRTVLNDHSKEFPHCITCAYTHKKAQMSPSELNMKPNAAWRREELCFVCIPALPGEPIRWHPEITIIQVEERSAPTRMIYLWYATLPRALEDRLVIHRRDDHSWFVDLLP